MGERYDFVLPTVFWECLGLDNAFPIQNDLKWLNRIGESFSKMAEHDRSQVA